MLLLQLLGVGIEFKAALLHRRHNGFSGFFADIGVVVQHPGHRGYRVAGCGCQVFNGQQNHPLSV